MHLNQRAGWILILLVGIFSARGSDWPQLLGPTHDAVYAGPSLLEEWPRNGPPVVWSAKVGEGYSNPVVADGHLILCHRIADDLIVDCLNPLNGTNFWTFKHSMKFQDGAGFDSGPRPTPTIRDGRVFVHNTDGYLVCLDLKNGNKLWSHQSRGFGTAGGSASRLPFSVSPTSAVKNKPPSLFLRASVVDPLTLLRLWKPARVTNTPKCE